MSEKRLYERTTSTIEVWFKINDQQVVAMTRDVSLGGMYIATPYTLSYGTKFQLHMNLPGVEEPSVVEATVRWLGDDGMGVQFGLLRARETWAINQILAGRPARTTGPHRALKTAPAGPDGEHSDNPTRRG